MELSLENCSYDGRWFDFGDARLKIRPYPASKINFAFRDGAVVMTGTQGFDKFKHCLVAWDQVVNAADKKPIELTAEVKQKVFDFRLITVSINGVDMTCADFVITKADELFTEAQASEKNSLPLPPIA